MQFKWVLNKFLFIKRLQFVGFDLVCSGCCLDQLLFVAQPVDAVPDHFWVYVGSFVRCHQIQIPVTSKILKRFCVL